MGTPRPPKPAKYFVGLLASDLTALDAVESQLSAVFGEIERRSEVITWNASKFYEEEMGPGLVRRFVSFSRLRSPEDLAAMKLETQSIEDRYRDGSGGRRVNLDPGYIDAYKLVLASTKNAGQRIYLKSGIYAEATLFYRDGGFQGLAYTYPDYLWPATREFFVAVRERYLSQLR